MSTGVKAPELNTTLGWLNTDRPLLFGGALRGHVVVLDFWTYCCINCMHILPDLAFLEEKYADEPVAFIGVHSAKFANEASRETIRAAILRYEIQHPVAIDDQMQTWRAYRARSWPTVVVVDSAGYVSAVAAGEGNREALDVAIRQALANGRSAETLAPARLTFKREAGVEAAGGLAFPGKVLADRDADRLYIADSNHNRIIIATMPNAGGRCSLVRVVGGGDAGRDDGPAERATFNHPQGLAVGQGNLYVADTENHLIRAVDLATFEVITVAGTGEMDNDRAGGLMGTDQGINSPWDLTMEGSTLYVAMAGAHQVWRIDMPVGFARAFAGSGRENLVDGPAEIAALAQTSGICAVGGNLYIADSEVSAIRGIDMATEQVFTVIGEGLFAFGDVDGAHTQARLQHPLGIDAWGQSLIIADTYNHKIKLVDPAGRSVRTLYGTGALGTSTPDGNVAFFEPGGLSVAGDDLFVADTNNHRVVAIDLATHNWHEIIIDGLTAPAGGDIPRELAADVIQTGPVAVREDADVELVLDVQLPEGTHLSDDAPWSARVVCGADTLAQQTGRSQRLPIRITIPASAAQFDEPWQVFTAFAYCTDDDRSLCIPTEQAWLVPASAGGDQSRISLSGAVTLPADHALNEHNSANRSEPRP